MMAKNDNKTEQILYALLTLAFVVCFIAAQNLS